MAVDTPEAFEADRPVRSLWDVLPSPLWAVLYLAAMFGGHAAKEGGIVGPPWSSALIPLALCLLVPMILAARHEARDDRSPALSEFRARVTIAVGFYVLAISGAVTLSNKLHGGAPPQSALGVAVALVPAVPMLGLVWAMARYLAEERDEYLRHLATMSALIGLAAVLVALSVVSTLELFGLAPGAWGFWLIPGFALAQHAGRSWLRARSR